MNIISKQYYKFLSILQKIFRITNSKEVKITKVDKGVICLENKENNDIEMSIANYPVKHCLKEAAKHIVFFYDGVHILDENDYDKYSNMNGPLKIIIAYNGKEIDFFSFTVDCLAADYRNINDNVELKKALSISEIISYSRKFITNPVYTRLLYNHINPEDLVQPLIATMDQIKNFLERNKMRHFNRLSIDKENKTISFRFVNKEITMSQNDISTASKNRYNIDYYESILKCLDQDIKFGKISTRQSFTANQFYEKLLSYNKRLDCLVPLKLVASTTEGQKTDKFTNVQETNTEHSVSPRYTQTLINPSIEHKGFAANTTKNKKISRITNMQSDSTRYHTPFSYAQTPARSSTEHSNLISCKPCSNGQQFSTSSLILIGAMSGLIILLVLAFVCYHRKQRKSGKVGTGINVVESAPLNSERHRNE